MATNQKPSPYAFVRSCIYAFMCALCLCLDFRGVKRNPNAITEIHTESAALEYVTCFRGSCSNHDLYLFSNVHHRLVLLQAGTGCKALLWVQTAESEKIRVKTGQPSPAKQTCVIKEAISCTI